jgi:PAS domain S-box-containing protein
MEESELTAGKSNPEESEATDDVTPLYNSRIMNIFVQYVKKHHPDCDIDEVLEYAGMTMFEVEDPAHWFTQRQADRFNEIVVSKIGDKNIAREAGRFLASSVGIGPAKQYVLGLMSPAYIYLLMEKMYSLFSRGANVKARKIGKNKVEVCSTPKPGVVEKRYQCENRFGTFESLAKLYTEKFAKIEHPECFHKGADTCRYIISWERTPSIVYKRIRNCSLLLGLLGFVSLLFVLPMPTWIDFIPLIVLIPVIFSFLSERQANRELARTIETQGDAARAHLEEINMRYHNALLVQEIGQATSTILNERRLVETVVSAMEKHLDFGRGAIMLANKENTRLCYIAGYGFSKEQEKYLRRTEFHLDNPKSEGIFVSAFREQKPILLDDISKVKQDFSKRILALIKRMDLQSLICVPIVYERESLGILAVDKVKPKRALTQSDVSLLRGVASQTVVSIINARSFQRLQESERKYRELVENANSIILRMDTNWNITFFNEFAQRFFGYREHEILGNGVIGTVLPDSVSTRGGLEKLVLSLQRDPDRQVVTENENIRRSGDKVWVAWTYRPIFDVSGVLKEILCIGNDITGLKRSEQEKKALESRLQRAQKMEAIGTLAGGVAHDLNNILTGLVSYPDLLLMEIPDGSPLREPIYTIQRSGEKAASIVQDLLTLARRGVATTEVVNLNHIVTEYLKSPVYEKLRFYHPDTEVETKLEDNLLNIIGSPTHLSQTVMNLVSNAAEAMPEGGKILISTESRYVDRPIKGYDDVQEGEYVTLTVSDTGVGISSEDVERIFEPFYTKKVMGRSGTGLGMAVVWGTVKDHKGYIDMQTTMGKGTTFTLYFPVVREGLSAESSPLSIEDYMGKGESILVIDDVEEQREIAARMLTKLGYSVKTASSGEEAVEYLKNHSADLLILDMIMDPGIDGLDTYKRILKIHPGQKAIIASGFSETARVKSAQRLGAGAYIKKPYLLEKIGLTVRAELNK